MSVMGLVVARHEPAATTPVDQPAASSETAGAASDAGQWSPGGLDEADREFFADLQAGGVSMRHSPPRPKTSPAAAPAARKPPPVMIAAAKPASSPATQPAPSRPEAVIQLGAFADAAVAKARWQTMSAQFPSLRPLAGTVAPISSGRRTLYRLQARGGDAASACPVLIGAGETCVVIARATAPATPPAAADPTPQPANRQRETVIQLGAFADAAIARARWQALSLKFPSLRPLTRSVSAVARAGHTVYRLRASGADAASACSAVAGSGATCFVATDAG